MEGETRAKLKRASILCLEGFKEACCLHRVFILCYRSRSLLLRTVPCFLLNGFIFLGSVLALNSFVIPILQWILPDHCPHIGYQVLCASGTVMTFYSILRAGLIQLFYLFWFYPLYIFSLILSTIWYSDIANQGFIAKSASTSNFAMSAPSLQNAVHQDRPVGLGGVVIGIGEQLYSILLLSFFFLEVYAAGLIPYAGKALNFLLLSWMYAYYCFEYKWSLSGVPLDKRLDFFESNWAFFAGFGCPCVLAIFLFPPLQSYAVMATLFPLDEGLVFSSIPITRAYTEKVTLKSVDFGSYFARKDKCLGSRNLGRTVFFALL